MSVFDDLQKAAKAGDDVGKRPSAGDAVNRAKNELGGRPNLARRDAKGRLLPGSPTLNPGGRPKGTEARLRELFEQVGHDGLTFEERCAMVANGAEIFDANGEPIRVDYRVRLEVGRWLYERAYGKALTRSENVNVEVDISGAYDLLEDLDVLQAVGRAARRLSSVPGLVLASADAAESTHAPSPDASDNKPPVGESE